MKAYQVIFPWFAFSTAQYAVLNGSVEYLTETVKIHIERKSDRKEKVLHTIVGPMTLVFW